MSRRAVVLVSLCVSHSAFAVENPAAKTDAGVLPAALPAARYEKMSKKSPFAPATPVAAPVTTQGYFADFHLTGLAKQGNKDFVTLQSRDGQTRYSVSTGESTVEGVTLVKVDWSDEIGKSKVTVKKGSESGVLEFDQATLQKAPPAGAPQMPQANAGQQFRGQPGAPRMPGLQTPQQVQQQARGGAQMPQLPGRTGWPQQQPQAGQQQPGRPVLQQPGIALPQPGNAQGQQPTDTRRRIRIINSGQQGQ